MNERADDESWKSVAEQMEAGTFEGNLGRFLAENFDLDEAKRAAAAGAPTLPEELSERLLSFTEKGVAGAFSNTQLPAAKLKVFEALREWRESEAIATTDGLLSQSIDHQTMSYLACVNKAMSLPSSSLSETADGQYLKYKLAEEPGPAEVLLSPEMLDFLPPVRLDDFYDKLDAFRGHGPMAVAILLSFAIKNDRPSLELDDFMSRLGLDPRSEDKRKEYRVMLWEAIQVFCRIVINGPIQGNYKDRKTGGPIKFIDFSPILVVTGKRRAAETWSDPTVPPIAVTFVAGNFLYKHRENQKLLTYLGDIRMLTAIPSGKPQGQWARSIGLSLHQIWREGASQAEVVDVGDGGNRHKTARFDLVTRREIFSRTLPNPSPYDILSSDHPVRALEYWDEAIELLRKPTSEGPALLSHYSGEKQELQLPRQGWNDTWLDEPLDLRPHWKNDLIIQEIAKIRGNDNAFKRKRGRPKKLRPAPPGCGT